MPVQVQFDPTGRLRRRITAGLVRCALAQSHCVGRPLDSL